MITEKHSLRTATLIAATGLALAGTAAALVVARSGPERAHRGSAASPDPAAAATERDGFPLLGLASPSDVPLVMGAARAIQRPGRGSANAPASADMQQYVYHDYSGQFTFLRIETAGWRRGMRTYRNIGNGGPGWSHDYPTAENQLSQILRALTNTRALVSDWGGNILQFDDPRLFQFPIAYVSEPGDWLLEEREIQPLREYLLKGGFIIFDDFSECGGGGGGRSRRGGNGNCPMNQLAENMSYVLPELFFQQLDGSEAIFDSFFAINLSENPIGRYLDWWGIFEDNDRDKRLIAIAGNGGDLGEEWEVIDSGFYIVDLRNEAFKFGVNYMVYAMTH